MNENDKLLQEIHRKINGSLSRFIESFIYREFGLYAATGNSKNKIDYINGVLLPLTLSFEWCQNIYMLLEKHHIGCDEIQSIVETNNAITHYKRKINTSVREIIIGTKHLLPNLVIYTYVGRLDDHTIEFTQHSNESKSECRIWNCNSYSEMLQCYGTEKRLECLAKYLRTTYKLSSHYTYAHICEIYKKEIFDKMTEFGICDIGLINIIYEYSL
jgi:hypothetical protein